MPHTFKSTGTFRYSPKRLGELAPSPNWWLVIDCDSAIGDYYRHLYHVRHYKCRSLQRPAWKEHISVVRNECPPEDRKCLWDLYEGQSVEFSYSTGIKCGGPFCWIDVECDLALDIREELGLSRQPHYELHLTIGNDSHKP